jgi:hypothetical protein
MQGCAIGLYDICTQERTEHKIGQAFKRIILCTDRIPQEVEWYAVYPSSPSQERLFQYEHPTTAA